MVRRLRKVIPLLFIMLAMLSSISLADELYKVVRVVDGDTIIVRYKGKDERLRFIGMDTPESVHPDASKNTKNGKIASDYSKSKLEGKSVSLEFDIDKRDRYDRLLAYVYLEGEMFNKTLVSEGYATVATYQPNVKYVSDFVTLERQARQNNKGFWNTADGFMPLPKEGAGTAYFGILLVIIFISVIMDLTFN